MDFKNLSLIGFMGSGKSTVGKLLAERLDFLFIDTDRIIEIKEKKPISEIFKEKGEKYFRDVESEVIRKIYRNKNCIFACGGGAILTEENFKVIKKSSKIIYLKVSPSEILKRVGNSKDRPLLQSKDKMKRVKALLGKRKGLYEKCADIIVDTDKKETEEVVNEIIERVK
ncbi:MAG: shikimate kinase [Candidatus Humimicrobiaceae bacterium]